MRILFLSNFYPPHSIGGYEQLCHETAEALGRLGHAVSVITGRQGGRNGVERDGIAVHRVLHLEVEGGLAHTAGRLLVSRQHVERANLSAVERIVSAFQPDVALVWGMWNVPRSVPATIERLIPDRVAYYFCDYWPTLPNAYIQRLREPARSALGSAAKYLMAAAWLPGLESEQPPGLMFRHAACVSRAVRDELVGLGVGVEHAAIIHLGIDPAAYVPALRQSHSPPLRLVYAGRLSPEKGVHTALEALGRLADEMADAVSLDVYGAGDPDYTTRLNRMAGGLPVTFHGAISRSQLASALPDYDAFIFPSEWPEPFAHAVLEAMAAGLAVIGTTTGGTGEVLEDGATGLTFPAGDAAALADRIVRLANDPGLRTRLAAAGREAVCREFDIEMTIDKLERLLMSVAEGAAVDRAGERYP